ncbi:hypothetical protein J2Y49_004085 [Azospirillum sp. BE72]|nr:hypothetical protein [Azospirillum sp. BE72]
MSGPQPHPYRFAIEAERLSDAGLRPAASVQRDDLLETGMAGGLDGGAPLLATGRWFAILLGLWRVRLLSGFVNGSDGQFGRRLQVPMMTGETLTQRIGEIVQEMPAVRDLNGGRYAPADAVGIGARTIAGNDLDAGMSLQPCGDGVGLAVGQQVDRAAVSAPDEYSSKGAAEISPG